MLKIIGLTGLSCSGKTYFAKEIQENFSVKIIQLGEYIRKNADNEEFISIKENTENFKNFSIGNFFEDTIEYCRRNSVPLIVDSIRTLEDLRFFSNKSDEFILVFIAEKECIRYERNLKRKRLDDCVSYDEFVTKSIQEMDFGLKELIPKANYCVCLSQPTDKQIMEIFSKIKGD